MSFDARGSRRADRERRRPKTRGPVLEALESRDLLTYSALGYSLPDLTVQGYAAPVAAYGGQLAVTVNVDNIGASSIPEGTNLYQGATSTADSQATTVNVYLSPRSKFGRGAILLGQVPVPAVAQNSVVQVTGAFGMPTQKPRGFPGNGGTLYVFFLVNANHTSPEGDFTNNLQRTPSPVQLAVNLPDLYTTALYTPPVMQPGDFIAPTIKVANYGTADPALQGTFEVDLVASTDGFFGPGDTVLTRFTVSSVPPLALVPSYNTVLGNVGVVDPINEITLNSPAVQLPVGDQPYFIGVIIDPTNQIREIHEVGRGPNSALDPLRRVAPVPGLPPATTVGDAAPVGNVFPIPPFGTITLGTTPIFDTPSGPFLGGTIDPNAGTTGTETTGTSAAAALARILTRRPGSRVTPPGEPLERPRRGVGA